MFQLIYIEKEIANYPAVEAILSKFSRATPVLIDHYGEVFNRKGQNFRLQKQNPALILAKKHQNYLHKTPEEYGIGTQENYYFSHLLNCPFDCRYCFLQGMFASANYVYFINLDDFWKEIEKIGTPSTTFFTGYDCDSLAFESVTGFARTLLPRIEKSQALFEFRTKSISIRPFLEYQPLKNCVIAFTLTPKEIGEAYEHRAPKLHKRLEAMQRLQEKEWQLGLRFDPMIYHHEYKRVYQQFFQEVFERLHAIHSVTLGGFRVPKSMSKKMISLYPEEPLFMDKEREEHLKYCREEVLKYVSEEKLYCYWSESGNRKSDQSGTDCARKSCSRDRALI